MKNKQKGAFPIFLIILILGAVMILIYLTSDSINFSKIKINNPITKPTACTLEAKICPDGSSVGRTGPNCEFTACPGSNNILDLEMKYDPTKPLTDPYGRYINPECKVISGCNGPINCVDKYFYSYGESTICEYLPEYACYKQNITKCEKQNNGKCGWTKTPELQSCIDSYSNNDVDNNFRKEGETCGEGIGDCEGGLECSYPCGIPGCQNVCMQAGSPPRP